MQDVNRSYLFVPGNRQDRFEKALSSGAHAVIIDLEDGVAPSEKERARESVSRWLNPNYPVILRLNSTETRWFREDLALCGKPGVSAVMLAKTETAEDVQRVVERAASEAVILPQIESARGIESALQIAKCAGVQRLAFGSLDLQADLGITGDDQELLYFRSHLVLVSRLAQLQAPVETPTTAIDSPDELRADTERARRLGFGGKLCIHPKQVPIVNECFQPTPDEVAWAMSVMEAAKAAGGAAVALNGKMVDRPMILKAEHILSDAGRGNS